MTVPAFYPDVAAVGAILASRTVDTSGMELGTFTEDTRPTDAQVDILIDNAAQMVISKIGDQIPESIEPIAQTTIAIRAAMFVELTYFPEQMKNDKSAYLNLKEMFDEQMALLSAAYANVVAGGTLGSNPDAYPSYGFPASGEGMIGWDTRW